MRLGMMLQTLWQTLILTRGLAAKKYENAMSSMMHVGYTSKKHAQKLFTYALA